MFRWMMVYMSQMNPILLPVDERYAQADEETRLGAARHWNAHNGPKHG